MGVLVRKINKGKWLQNDICAGDDVSADAITSWFSFKGQFLSKLSFLSRFFLTPPASAEQNVIRLVQCFTSYISQINVIFCQLQGGIPIQTIYDPCFLLLIFLHSPYRVSNSS